MHVHVHDRCMCMCMTDACACAWQVHIDLQHMGVGGDDSWTHLRTVAETHYVQAEQTIVVMVVE